MIMCVELGEREREGEGARGGKGEEEKRENKRVLKAWENSHSLWDKPAGNSQIFWEE